MANRVVTLQTCSLRELVDYLGEILPPAEAPRRPPTTIRRDSTGRASISPTFWCSASTAPRSHRSTTLITHRCHFHGDSFWEDHHSRWSWFIHSKLSILFFSGYWMCYAVIYCLLDLGSGQRSLMNKNYSFSCVGRSILGLFVWFDSGDWFSSLPES